MGEMIIEMASESVLYIANVRVWENIFKNVTSAA